MMMRPAYPPNWEALALACKERAGWRCEHCGIAQHSIVTSRKGNPYIIYLAACHKHHDKSNPEPELIALCVRCHGQLDWQHRQQSARIRLECLKHLRLLVAAGVVEVRLLND